jgi:membrane associated rhomboid family serine protease
VIARDTVLTRPLEDCDYFRRAFVEAGALTWPNGLEFSGHSLHARSLPTNAGLPAPDRRQSNMERLRNAWASAALFLLLGAAFLGERAAGAVGSDERLLALGALPDGGGLHGQYWRLLTFGFLHSGTLHFLLNSLLLLLAGPAVERRAGPLRFALVFLGASIASGAAILVKHEAWPASGVSVGASGGMFGLLGAALVLVWRARGERPLARALLGAALAGGLAYSLLPGISLLGHLVGLAVGAGAAIAMAPRNDAFLSSHAKPPRTPGKG